MLLKAQCRAVEATPMAGGWGGLPSRCGWLLWGTCLDQGGESGLEQREGRQGPQTEEIREAGGRGEQVSKAALLDRMETVSGQPVGAAERSCKRSGPRPLSNQRSPKQSLCWEGDM